MTKAAPAPNLNALVERLISARDKMVSALLHNPSLSSRELYEMVDEVREAQRGLVEYLMAKYDLTITELMIQGLMGEERKPN